MLEELIEEKDSDKKRQIEQLEERVARLTEQLIVEKEKSQRLASYQSQ